MVPELPATTFCSLSYRSLPIIAVSTALLIFLLSGCASASLPPAPTGGSPSTQALLAYSGPPTPTLASKDITQTSGLLLNTFSRRYSKMTITLKQIDWLAASTSGHQPKSGNVYVVVYVGIVNNGANVSENIGPQRFSIVDANGVIRTATILAAPRDCALEDVALLPNGTIEGCLGFEVPAARALSLVYTPFDADYLEGPGRILTFPVR